MKKISTFASLMRDFCCIFFFIIIFSSFSFAYPQIGHQFYGYAGSGDTVTAVVGTFSYATDIDSDGYYGYDPLFFVDAASDDIDGAEEGDTITFYVDGTWITAYTFEIGGVTELDLSEAATTTTTAITDSDGDGVPDDEDVCEGYDDTVDTDSDGTPDGCDTDDDGDGVPDSKDICPGYDDTMDSDKDGIPDGCDSDDDNDGTNDSNDSDDDNDGTSDWDDEDEKEDGGASSGIPCHHDWECTDWNDCEENGFQTRICFYNGTCAVEGDQQDSRQTCTYMPEEIIVEEEESCFDGIQNQGERGVDCGGPCDSCPTVPVTETPETNWWYYVVAGVLLLLIVAVILAHKYKDKLEPWWEKVKSKFGKKPAAGTASQVQQRPVYQQQYAQYRPQMQQYKR